MHEAIEAKEGLQVQRESRVVATITFQIFFAMYRKLAGMTVRRGAAGALGAGGAGAGGCRCCCCYCAVAGAVVSTQHLDLKPPPAAPFLRRARP
jgi:hypothetical protein